MTDDLNSPRLRSYASLSDDVNGIGGGPEANSLTAAFEDMVRLLRDLHIRYAVVGAFAVAAYVSQRRSTLDIDVVVEEGQEQNLRKHAVSYNFNEVPAEGGREGMLRFQHDAGAMLDVILNPEGFAELDKVNMVDWPKLGQVAVASAEDVAWSKMRTQDQGQGRPAEKRLIDRADVVALLRSDPHLADVLWQRSQGAFLIPGHVKSTLVEICAEAGLPPPAGSALSARRRLLWLVILAAAVVTGALIAWVARAQ